MYYHTCKICGANLDPGEQCTCTREKKSKAKQEEPKKQEYKIISKSKK